MTRIRLILLSMLAVVAISAVASASASAVVTCAKVAEAKTGTFKDSNCKEAEAKSEYIKIEKLETVLKSGEYCAKVSVAKTGRFATLATCEAGTPVVAEGEYIRVSVPTFVRCAKVATGEPSEWEAGCKVKKVGGGYAKVLAGPGTCARVAQPTEPSSWSNATCTTAKVGKGEYIKVEAGKLKFTDKEGVSHLYGAGAVVFTCEKDTSKGAITGPTTTAEVTVTFTECTAKEGTGAPCSAKSTGEPAGTIKTNLLKDSLNAVEKPEAPNTEVGESLEPVGTAGFVTLEATCLATKTEQVSGSVIGEVKPINVMQTTGELIFACEPAKSTKQKIKFSEGVKDVLLTFGLEACFESTAAITFEEPIEVEYP
jgi:hypothetical protein